MPKTVLAFIVGTYVVVFPAVMLGAAVRPLPWLIGTAVFLLVVLLGLWLGFGDGRRSEFDWAGYSARRPRLDDRYHDGRGLPARPRPGRGDRSASLHVWLRKTATPR